MTQSLSAITNQRINIFSSTQVTPFDTLIETPNDNSTSSISSISATPSFCSALLGRMIRFFSEFRACSCFCSLLGSLFTRFFGRNRESTTTSSISEGNSTSTTAPYLQANHQILRGWQGRYGIKVCQRFYNGLALGDLEGRFQNILEGRELLAGEFLDQCNQRLRHIHANHYHIEMDLFLFENIDNSWQRLWENGDANERDYLERASAGLFAIDEAMQLTLKTQTRWLARPTEERIAYNQAVLNTLHADFSNPTFWDTFNESLEIDRDLHTLHQRLLAGIVKWTAESAEPIHQCLNRIRSFENYLRLLENVYGSRMVERAIATLQQEEDSPLAITFQHCRLGLQAPDDAFDTAVELRVRALRGVVA